MAQVFLGVGSNTEREHHIHIALTWLSEQFPVPRFSSVYESAAIGFQGRPFYNFVVEIQTTLSIAELNGKLKAVEFSCGRQVDTPRFAPRNLDLDILTYDQTVGEVDGVVLPRREITYNAFVLWPLAEVAGACVHPESGKSYQALWDDFDQGSQQLHRIDFPGWPDPPR